MIFFENLGGDKGVTGGERGGGITTLNFQIWGPHVDGGGGEIFPRGRGSSPPEPTELR